MVFMLASQWSYIEKNLRTPEDWERLNFVGDMPTLQACIDQRQETNNKVAIVCKCAMDFFDQKMSRLIHLRELPSGKMKIWKKREALLEILETKLFEILPEDAFSENSLEEKPCFYDFFKESLARCIVLHKQIFVFRCLTYLKMNIQLLPKEQDELHAKLGALTLYNQAALACNCLLDWIILEPSIAIPKACELFEKHVELLSAEKLYRWFVKNPEVKNNLKSILSQLISANKPNINSQLLRLVAFTSEQFTLLEKIAFLNCAQRAHNKSIFRFLLISLFDAKESLECYRDINKHVEFLSQSLIFWIENAPVFLQTPAPINCEEVSLKTIVQEIILDLLKYTNFSVVRFPYHPEPILDAEGLYGRQIKKRGFCAALLQNCFMESKERQKRSRWVAGLIAQKDASFDLLYRHFCRMSQKKAASEKIIDKLNKVLSVRTVINIPLTAHQVPQGKQKLFKWFLSRSTVLEKKVQNAWRIRVVYHEFFGKNGHTIEACLKKIGILENFLVKPLKCRFQWFRDVFFPISAGKVLIPFVGPKYACNDALEIKLRTILPYNSAYFTALPLQQQMMGNPYKFSKLYFGWMQSSELPFTCKESTFYFEGGNLLRVINRKNETIILCGALNLVCAFIVAELNQTFTSLEMQEKIQKKINELLGKNTLQVQLLKETKDVLKILYKRKDISLKDAYQAVAKIEVIRDELQEELQSPMLVLESGHGFDQAQLELHIDMYILPAPNGVVFVQSYEVTVHTLQEILDNSRLSFLELKVLNSFLKYARLLRRRDEKRLRAVCKQLEQLDLTVIKVPGIYVNKHYNINYLNSIAGQGSTGSFVITNGFKGIPGEGYLRDAFTMFLQAKGIDSVYFQGHDLKKTMETSPDWDLESLKMIQLFGGIHCRSLEFFSSLA